MVGEACCERVFLPTQETAEMAVIRAGRQVTIAELLPESERVLSVGLLIRAAGTLSIVYENGIEIAADPELILVRIYDLALILESDKLNNELQLLFAE